MLCSGQSPTNTHLLAVATGSSVVDAGVVVVVASVVVLADSMFLRAKSVLQNWGDWKHLEVDYEYFIVMSTIHFGLDFTVGFEPSAHGRLFLLTSQTKTPDQSPL